MVGHVLSWHKGLNLILGSTEKETEMGEGKKQWLILFTVQKE